MNSGTAQSCSEQEIDWNDLTVRLVQPRCGDTALGQKLRPTSVLRGDVFRDARIGFEVGTHGGMLDYVSCDVDRFPGRIVSDDAGVTIGCATTEDDWISALGEPWWRDADTDEIVLFYEDGQFELQLELSPDGCRTTWVTLMRRPLLADPDQRLAYGVTKPWPPTARP